MPLRQKILIRSILATIFMIAAMSGIYYGVFTRDIRERSRQTVETAFQVVLDDMRLRVNAVQTRLADFTQRALPGPLYSIAMLQGAAASASSDDFIWNIKKMFTYANPLALNLTEFADLTGAVEIQVYTRERQLLAVYQQGADGGFTGVRLPEISREQIIPLSRKDRWPARLQRVEEIPLQPLPAGLTLEYSGEFPDAAALAFSVLRQSVAIRFTAPILDRGNPQGICVIYLAFRPQDAQRYAALSGTQANVFAGTALSVGTLPEHAALPAEFLTANAALDARNLSAAPVVHFATVAAGKESYYQGLITLGDGQRRVGAIAMLYPRRLETRQKSRLFLIVAGVTASFILLAIIESIGLSNAMVRPIMALMGAIKEMKQGNLDAQAVVTTRDELEVLAETFNAMGQELKASVERQKEQERLRNEMELARRIQTALLPSNMVYDGFEIEAVMLPAEEVGGDYYDVLVGSDGALWLAIGDVSGHGVTPGLVMMIAQTIHATITTQFSTTPKDVVETVNRVLFQSVHERLHTDHFMTFTTLKYEGNGRFTHAGAHLDLIVHRHATQLCELIDTSGVFLNFIPEITHATRNATFTLDVGDTLVLYTDGLTEAWSPQREMLDMPGFLEIVRRHAGNAAAAMRDAIMQDVLAWCGSRRDDDMSLVIVRRKQ